MGINLLGELGFDDNSTEVRNAREAAAVYATVIDALVECREESGLRQKVIAKRMGTTQSAVSNLENAGADARFSTVVRYAQAIGCQLSITVVVPSKGEWEEARDWIKVDFHNAPKVAFVPSYSNASWRAPDTVRALYEELPKNSYKSFRLQKEAA